MQRSTVVLLLQKIQNLNIIKIIETLIPKAETVLTLLPKYFMRVESLRKTPPGIMIKEVLGNYEKVYKDSYKLLPGDFVAYEKKGDITHISVVSGADSKGYTLVTCHNTDRCDVPWDLGWSDKKMKFWLIRVHF